jgi:hypothetical protein
MSLRRKLSLKATVATLVIAFPLMLLIAGGLNPQIRNRVILDRYLKETNPEWDAFRRQHPEFRQLEFIITTQPALFLREEVAPDASFDALQAFFTAHQPPLSIPLSITLDVSADGTLVDRYNLNFPRNPNGSFAMGGKSPALPQEPFASG